MLNENQKSFNESVAKSKSLATEFGVGWEPNVWEESVNSWGIKKYSWGVRKEDILVYFEEEGEYSDLEFGGYFTANADIFIGTSKYEYFSCSEATAKEALLMLSSLIAEKIEQLKVLQRQTWIEDTK